MSIRNTRAGVSQASFNEDAINIVGLEIVALAVAVGIGKNSWWWGGGTFVGCAIIMAIPVLNILFCFCISAVWAAVGFTIGSGIGQNGANYVLGGIAGLCSLGLHLGAIEWTSDMGAKD